MKATLFHSGLNIDGTRDTIGTPDALRELVTEHEDFLFDPETTRMVSPGKVSTLFHFRTFDETAALTVPNAWLPQVPELVAHFPEISK